MSLHLEMQILELSPGHNCLVKNANILLLPSYSKDLSLYFWSSSYRRNCITDNVSYGAASLMQKPEGFPNPDCVHFAKLTAFFSQFTWKCLCRWLIVPACKGHAITRMCSCLIGNEATYPCTSYIVIELIKTVLTDYKAAADTLYSY